MASLNSITFNAGSGGVAGVYSPGDAIDAAIDYTPDVPSVVPQSFTFTGNVVNSGGGVVATLDAPFTVNTPQGGGDTVTVSDTGSRAWTEGATTPDPATAGNLDVTFSSTA